MDVSQCQDFVSAFVSVLVSKACLFSEQTVSSVGRAMDVGQWQNSSAAMCELDNLQLRANQVGFYSFVSLFVAQCELRNLQLRVNQVGFSRFYSFLFCCSM